MESIKIQFLKNICSGPSGDEQRLCTLNHCQVGCPLNSLRSETEAKMSEAK